MSKNKISIITAVYNTEKFVEKCINSLLNQTYKNIELIIVEDCSTDNSKKTIKKFENYDNVKIIYNKENKGLSYSRNIGLENATGDYIGYIDSDDYVDEDYYEKLMNSLMKNKSDIAICDMKIVYEFKNNEEVISKCCNADKFSKVNVINNGLAASACNKLFKRELISKYKFDEGKVNEDIAVIIPTIVNAKKISYAENCYYYYVQRGGSIQNSSFSFKRFDIFYGVEKTLERIKGYKDYKQIKDALIYNQLIVMLIYIVPKEKDFFKRRKIIKKFNELSKDYKIRQNIYFWNFLEANGKKHKLYYKILFKLVCNSLYYSADLLIMLYNIAKKYLSVSVLPNYEITLEELKKLAQIQSEKQNNVKISVVIPNYNYERYLVQRIYSILKQTEKIHEIIILDDCSKDNSRDLIDKIEKELSKYIKVSKVYNDINSGSPFIQWEKGLKLAEGDYVWIAEADDYCEKTMLKELIKPIKKENDIVISYVDTAFINAEGNIILKSIKSEIDIQKTGHWDKSYVNNGIDEIKKYSFLNCTIANVSSCIIKKGDYIDKIKESRKYRQAGDWLFYVNIMANGKVAYSNKPLNYYRVHGNNVSSTMNQKKHIEEINSIHDYYVKKFNLNKNHKLKMNQRIKFLEKVWNIK